MPAVRSLARRAAPISKKIIKAEVTDPPVDLNSFDISPVLKKRYVVYAWRAARQFNARDSDLRPCNPVLALTGS